MRPREKRGGDISEQRQRQPLEYLHEDSIRAEDLHGHNDHRDWHDQSQWWNGRRQQTNRSRNRANVGSSVDRIGDDQ